jgi:hypothetical protein
MLAPIIVDTEFRDRDGNGVIEFGTDNRRKYGVKVVYDKGQREDGKWVYWPEGYAPPKPRERITTPLVELPVLAADAPTKSGATFIGSGEAYVRGNMRVKGMSAVYKVRTDVNLKLLSLSNIDADRIGVLFRNYGGNIKSSRFDRIRMTNAQYSGGVGAGIFHSGNGECSDVQLTNLFYRRIEPLTAAGDIYNPITLAGKDANDWGVGFLFRGLDFEGMYADYDGTRDAGGYENADGISIERGYTDGRVEDALIRFGSDAGIDCKAPRWVYKNLTVEGFRENLKFWNNFANLEVRSIDPRNYHMQIASGATAPRTIEFDWFQPEGDKPTKPLCRAEGPHTLIVHDGDMSKLPKGQVVMSGPKGSKAIVLGKEYLPGQTLAL